MRRMGLKQVVFFLIVSFIILLIYRFNFFKIVNIYLAKINPVTNQHDSTDQDWTELFPEIKSLLSESGIREGIPLINYTTSPELTYVFLQIQQHYSTGDTVEAGIEARDFYNSSKKYGGDFFRAILHQDRVLNKGVTCKIDDLTSGKYKVSCPLLWSGPAQLTITLIHPSESLFMLIRNSSGSREPGVTLKANVKSMKTGKEELVPCSFSFTDILNESQVCNHSNPRNGEPWFCVRPSSGDCPPILWMDRYYDDKKNEQWLGNKPNFKKGFNWRVPVGRSFYKIIVDKDDDIPNQYKLGPCLEVTKSIIPQDPSEPTGWFSDGKWNSLLCNNIQFNVETMQKCLQNYTLYFTGDSTVRYWYKFFIEAIGAIDKGTNAQTVVWAQARNGFHPQYNISLNYRAHGPPLHNSGTTEVRPYITDTMDMIGSNVTRTVFIFSIGLHMDLFNPNYYLHRLRGIREAVIRLKQRSPNIRFFVKGLHAHSETTRICPSDWYSYRHDRILRHVFRDVEGLIFLPYWDMSAVLDNKVLHPPNDMLRHQMGLLQSFLCLR